MADLRAVTSAAGCRRPIVLGFSDGGPIAMGLAAAHRRSVRALILYGTSPRRPPGSVMRQLRMMTRHWGQGDSLAMFAPTLAGELARHDRAVFERASASPAMIRALVESLADTDVRSRWLRWPCPPWYCTGARISCRSPRPHSWPGASGERGWWSWRAATISHGPGTPAASCPPSAEFVGEVSGRPGRRAAAAPAARPRRPVTGWGALTDAERRVAQLVAEGLANREVAERLFLSRYTVETHLKHVFTKLGVSSRAELAALASRNT